MKKLVSESLNEFVHPGVGGYSLEQMDRDLRDIIHNQYGHLNMEEEDIDDFIIQKMAPAFDRGYIQSEEGLLKFIEKSRLNMRARKINEGAWGHGPLDNDGASDWKWEFGGDILQRIEEKIENGMNSEDPVDISYLYYSLGMWEFLKKRLKTQYSFFSEEQIKDMDNLISKAAKKLMDIDYAKKYEDPKEVESHINKFIK